MSRNRGRYTPLHAFKTLKQAAPQVTAGQKITGPMLVEDGQPLTEIRHGPATLCLLLRGFAEQGTVLPDDFDTVERSASGLKGHVRPDGGVYLGAFETKHDPAGVVVVFGDPELDSRDALRAAAVFRARLDQQLAFDAHQQLGPFAAPLAVSSMTSTGA